MASKNLVLEKCIEFKVHEAKRYFQSCHIYLILNEFLTEEKLGSIISIEKEFRRISDNKKVEVDTIIKISDSQFNIIEFKTSVRDEDAIIKTLKQLEERDTDLKVDTKEIKITHLILLCHLDDVEKIMIKFNELISSGKLIINRPVIFLSWAQKSDKGDIHNYYIKYHKGDFSNNQFIDKIQSFKQGLKKDVIRTIMKSDKEKYFFTNKRPCKQYLYFCLKTYIHQRISSILMEPRIEETVDLLQIDKEFKTFLERMGNNLVRPRKAWFKDALDYFVKELKWVKIKNDKIIEISIDKFKSRRKMSNDEFKFFSKRVCQKEIKKLKKQEKKRKEIRKKHGDQQKLLTNFPKIMND